MKGWKPLNEMFIRQLSLVFNWQANDISNVSLEECRSHVSNVKQASDCIGDWERYVREDIPYNLVVKDEKNNIFYVELNLSA